MVEEHARRKSLLASIFCSADAVETFLSEQWPNVLRIVHGYHERLRNNSSAGSPERRRYNRESRLI